MELVIDARRPLLEGAVDYLPEAAEDGWLGAAVDVYRTAVAGPLGWVVGRFCCPSSALEDLASILTQTMEAGDRPWHVGVIFDEPLGTAAMNASVFHKYMDPAGAVASIEVKDPDDAAYLAEMSAAAAGISPVTAAIVGADQLCGPDAASQGRQPVAALVSPETATQPVRLASWSADGVAAHLAAPTSPSDFVRCVAVAALVDNTESAQQAAASNWPEFSVSAVGVRWRSELVAAIRIRQARSTVRSFRSTNLEATFDQLRKLKLIDGAG